MSDTRSCDATRYWTELFFSEVLPDLLGNLEEDAIVIIMQRLHERDVSKMGYTHVLIPMEYESRLYVNALTVNDQGKDVIKTFFDDQAAAIPEEDIFWRDWRTEDGELAWLERFPEPSKNRYARFWRAAYLRMADCELRQACAFSKHYPPENYVIGALSDRCRNGPSLGA